MSVQQQQTMSDSSSSSGSDDEEFVLNDEECRCLAEYCISESREKFIMLADTFYRQGKCTTRTMNNAFVKTEEYIGHDFLEVKLFGYCAELVYAEFKQGKRTL